MISKELPRYKMESWTVETHDKSVYTLRRWLQLWDSAVLWNTRRPALTRPAPSWPRHFFVAETLLWPTLLAAHLRKGGN